MQPLLLQTIGSSVAKLGADLLVGQSRAAMSHAPPPPPKVFVDGGAIDDAASAALARLKTLGIAESEALKAIVREESDRRVHARINEVFSAGWEQASNLQRSDTSVPGWVWGLASFAGGFALGYCLFSRERA